MSFDQTLGNTGVVVVKNDGETIEILHSDIFKRTDPLSGFAMTIQRGIDFKKELQHWMVNCSYLSKLTAIVHEMPAVRGYRTESSLMAAFIIRQVIDEIGLSIPVHSISNQHSKKVLGLKKNATKAEVKFAVENILGYDSENKNRPKIWNQHVSDAAMLGLTYLSDSKNEVGK